MATNNNIELTTSEPLIEGYPHLSHLQAIKFLACKGKIEKIIDYQNAFDLNSDYIGSIFNELFTESPTEGNVIPLVVSDTSDTLNEAEVEVEPEIEPKKEYYLYKLAHGAEIREYGRDAKVGNVTEYEWVTEGYEDGDFVEVAWFHDGASVTRVVRHGVSTIDERLEYFRDGILTSHDEEGFLYVRTNIMGETLDEYHPLGWKGYNINLRYLPKAYGTVSEGDLVTLVWDKSQPNKVYVRNVVHTEDLPTREEHYKTSKNVEKGNKSSSSDLDDNSDSPLLSTLDFDLEGKSVVLVVGDSIREKFLVRLVEEHNGVASVLDAFKAIGNKSRYQTAFKDADIVITVKDYMKHSSAYLARDVVKELGISMAMADGVGAGQIERALYRALNGLSSDESGLPSDFDYPLLRK